MKTLSAIIIITFFSVAVFAQAGELDSTFGLDGKVTTSVAVTSSAIHKLAIQPDGKIIAAGVAKQGMWNDWRSCLVRYNTDGTLDATFGTNGIFYYGGIYYGIHIGYAQSLSIQPDGKIVFAGQYLGASYIARLNTNGTFDTTFRMNGVFTDSGLSSINDLAILPDGKIIGGGEFYSYPDQYFAVVRYEINGKRDSSFGSNGLVISDANQNFQSIKSLVIQPDEKIIGCGSPNYQFALIRYNPNGTLDSSFGIGGIVKDSLIKQVGSIALQTDGKIVTCGWSSNDTNADFEVVRFLQDGLLDSGFGSNGRVITSTSSYYDGAASVAIQIDKKIVAVGLGGNYPSDFALVRYNTNGSVDSSFGINGIVTTDFGNSYDGATSVCMAADGTIVTGGYGGSLIPDISMYTLARYLSGLNVGILNFSSSQSSPLIYPNPIQQTETLEYNLTQSESLTIALYDVKGILIKKFISNELRAAGEHRETLNIGELTLGNYFLTLSNGSQKMTVKMVKQ